MQPAEGKPVPTIECNHLTTLCSDRHEHWVPWLSFWAPAFCYFALVGKRWRFCRGSILASQGSWLVDNPQRSDWSGRGTATAAFREFAEETGYHPYGQPI